MIAVQHRNVASQTVLCHGCFDILHLGHIRHLQEARSWGDRLIVSVTDDMLVNKGIGRPHFTAAQRVEALKALECVDDAFINGDPDPSGAIARLRPAIFAKGIDYADPHHPGHVLDKAACEANGVEFRVTTTEKWSSSRLINSEKFSDDVLRYLEDARDRNFLPKILAAFDAADELTIAFIGEAITDEYRFVRALGKSNKEFTLATVETGHEAYAGGVWAASLHGEWENVHAIHQPYPIKKTRFVDADFNRKLFEVYSESRLSLSKEIVASLWTQINDAVDVADLVIVLDFGHGLIDHSTRRLLSRESEFLALNAQTNSGNQGFNPITLYESADYICIDDPEARFAALMPTEPMVEVVEQLSGVIECPRFLITHGSRGSFYYDKLWGSAPAFISGGVDTMGAGDAVLAVTAPLIAVGLNLEVAALVGNVVGAIKVSILGHRRHVGRQEIIATLESLLK
jgi:cytidyltransferase-like protein